MLLVVISYHDNTAKYTFLKIARHKRKGHMADNLLQKLETALYQQSRIVVVFVPKMIERAGALQP